MKHEKVSAALQVIYFIGLGAFGYAIFGYVGAGFGLLAASTAITARNTDYILDDFRRKFEELDYALEEKDRHLISAQSEIDYLQRTINDIKKGAL